MKITQLRELDVKALNEKLVALLKERFVLRMKKADSEFKQHHLWKSLRHDIARVKTLIKQKEAA